MSRAANFSLALGNGQKWRLTTTDAELLPWMGRLASIMELSRDGRDPCYRLIFTRGLDRARLITEGWKSQGVIALRLWSHPEIADVIFEVLAGEGVNYEIEIMRMFYALLPIYQRARAAGALPLHAALVEWKEKGILLSAPGDAGKSTCCRLLPADWQAWCDDETLVVRNAQGLYRAHPFPTWSEYLNRRSEPTWNVERHLPVSAVFFLEQAETCEAIAMGQGRAAVRLCRSAIEASRRTWLNLSREEETAIRRELFENACELTRDVPSYLLRVSLDGAFWESMEDVLGRG